MLKSINKVTSPSLFSLFIYLLNNLAYRYYLVLFFFLNAIWFSSALSSISSHDLTTFLSRSMHKFCTDGIKTTPLRSLISLSSLVNYRHYYPLSPFLWLYSFSPLNPITNPPHSFLHLLFSKLPHFIWNIVHLIVLSSLSFAKTFLGFLSLYFLFFISRSK